jgi:hypothetical protein
MYITRLTDSQITRPDIGQHSIQIADKSNSDNDLQKAMVHLLGADISTERQKLF